MTFGALSSNVPWGGAIAIAFLAAIGAPTAISLQNRHQDRTRKAGLKHAAYARLIAASEVVAFRATVLGGQRSVRHTFSHSLSDFRKAVLVLLIGSTFGRWLNKRPDIMRTFIDAIPTPMPFEDSVDLKSLHASIEELIRSNIEVNLYGTKVAVAAAEVLLNDVKSFFNLISSGTWTVTGLPEKRLIEETREKMNASTTAFVAISRQELKPI